MSSSKRVSHQSSSKIFTVNDKRQMWKQFDNEIGKNIDCVYNKDSDRDTCDICDFPLLLNDVHYLTCSNKKCGKMYKDRLDFNAEWRFYGADDNNSSDPTRCGMPVNPLLKQSSFGCKVNSNYRSSYEMQKIRRYTEWQAMPYKEKSQYDEFQRIIAMASEAGIQKIIIDEAMRYHKKVSEKKTFRGLNRDGIIAASIYIACRVNNSPRTAREIASMFHLDHASATKGCKNATLIINEMESEMTNLDKTSLCRTKPESFINRYCSKLNMNSELTRLCVFMSVKINKNNWIAENTPHAIAAGIVYFVSNLFNLNISKQDVHRISSISEVTINKCFKKLCDKKDELVPKVITKKYGIV
jgi:transcription initiation factor TFIIB